MDPSFMSPTTKLGGSAVVQRGHARVRGLRDATTKIWAMASARIPTLPSARQVQQRVLKFVDSLDLPRWSTQHPRSRFARLMIPALLVLVFIYFWAARRASFAMTAVTPDQLLQDVLIPGANTTTRLPHIPPKIWQIYLSFTPSAVSTAYVISWISKSPSYSYTILDAQGALAIVAKLSSMPNHAHVLPLFYAMSRRVLRADFLRYLLLAIEGGIYSDMDTQMVRPIHEWVPDEFKSRTKLIVGLEADSSPPVPETTYEVQFCQWTLAGAAGHPIFWSMVDRILEKVRDRPYENPPKDVEYSDSDVLEITGPAGWSEVVYEHLCEVTGTSVTWRNLTGMRKPMLFGDTLVLPIDGFATGVPHSNASKVNTPNTMVKHQFNGAWKNGHG